MEKFNTKRASLRNALKGSSQQHRKKKLDGFMQKVMQKYSVWKRLIAGLSWETEQKWQLSYTISAIRKELKL